MSTTTQPAAPGSMHLDVSRTAKVPFSRLVQVELRKAYDTRASRWLLISIALLVVLTEGIFVAIVVTQDDAVSWGDFVGAAAFVTAILLPILGIMVVTSEWGQRTAMVTFTLEPRRPMVIYAKLVTGFVLTIATVVISIVVGLLCNLICVAALGHGSWEFGWNYLIGFVLTQTIAMLGGFALAALLLNTPAAIVAFFVYKWVLPILLFTASGLIGWFDKVGVWINFLDAQGPLTDLSLSGGDEWAHLIVNIMIWLVLPLALGLRRILRAEVK